MASHQPVKPRPTVPANDCDARRDQVSWIVVFSCREQVLQLFRLQTCGAAQELDSICQEPVFAAAHSTQYLHGIEHVLGLMVWRTEAAVHSAHDARHIRPKVLQRCPLRIELNRIVGLKQSL